MIEQGFYIGKRDWWVMVYYDVRTPDDFQKAEGALMAAGCPEYMRSKALAKLHEWNRGYTFSDLGNRTSILLIGKATDASQMFDSIVHEMNDKCGPPLLWCFAHIVGIDYIRKSGSGFGYPRFFFVNP